MWLGWASRECPGTGVSRIEAELHSNFLQSKSLMRFKNNVRTFREHALHNMFKLHVKHGTEKVSRKKPKLWPFDQIPVLCSCFHSIVDHEMSLHWFAYICMSQITWVLVFHVVIDLYHEVDYFFMIKIYFRGVTLELPTEEYFACLKWNAYPAGDLAQVDTMCKCKKLRSK